MFNQINSLLFYKSLISKLSRGIVVINSDYEVIRWNNWMEKHSGISEPDIMGQNIFDIFPDIRERNKDQYITQCIEKEKSFLMSPFIHNYLIPLDILKDDKPIRMFQFVKIYPFFDDDRNICAVILIRDLTEQILYEKEIGRLTRILKGIRDIHKLMIRAQSEPELFAGACEILVRDIGYKLSWIGLIEKKSFDILPVCCIGIEPEMLAEIKVTWDDSEYGQGVIGRAVRSGNIHFADQIQKNPRFIPWWRFAEKVGYHSLCALPLKVDEHVIGVLNIHSAESAVFQGEELELLEEVASDISFSVKTLREREKQHHAESQLRHSQKMEAIGTLAGGIAHDFNNILSIIIGYAETIKMFDLAQDSPLIPKMNEMLSASYRAKDLVQQILTFCYKTEQQKHPLQVGLIIKEALKFLRSSLPSTIDIRQRIRTKEMVMADPTHMHQVIINLCTNAAHAMRENGGILEISLDEAELDDPDVLYSASLHSQNLTRGQYLRITVKDTGHGMDSGVIERIFEPYFTTKKQGEGTGLGLAMVQGIVHGHGGAVTVDSKPGRGSTFRVFLPKLMREQSQPESAKSSRVSLGRNECILFVDDEEQIVEVGLDALRHLGYEAVAKRSSTEALETFREQPYRFDLVITDQTMPEMTGDILAHEMLRIRPDIPIILCTGYSEKITQEKARAAGIRAFVAKPLGTKKLANIIRSVLDQRIANSE